MNEFERLLKNYRVGEFFKCTLKDGTVIRICSDGSVSFSNHKNKELVIEFLNYIAEEIKEIRLTISSAFDNSERLEIIHQTKFNKLIESGVFYVYAVENKKD